MGQKQIFEIEIGVAYGTPSSQWDTFWVEVEASETASDETIKEMALEKAREKFRLDRTDYAHCWVHSLVE